MVLLPPSDGALTPRLSVLCTNWDCIFPAGRLYAPALASGTRQPQAPGQRPRGAGAQGPWAARGGLSLSARKEIAMARRWNGVKQLLFSKAAACVTTCLGIVIVLGCMNISLGGHSAAVALPLAEEPGAFEQAGRLPVRTGPEPQVVYYAVPFAARPNLEIEDPSGLCDIVDQQENC